jgi:uncharacterized protein YjeT (DUF2065 family)
MNRQTEIADQVAETAKDYANKAREVGEDAIELADEYLRPIGLSLKERPMTTLAVFGGIAFVAGAAFWMLRNSQRQSRLDGLLAQLPDLSGRSRSWW